MMYEVRAMSFAEILDTGFRILRNDFSLLVGIAAVIYVPPQVLSALIAHNADMTLSPATIAAGAITVLVVIVGWPIVFAAITYAIGQLYLGRPVSFGESLRFGASILFPLAGTTLLYWLAIMGGLVPLLIFAIFTSLGYLGLAIMAAFILLIVLGVFGIYLALAFMLIWQVMVLERVFGTAALRRSRELMRENIMRGAGIMFVCGLIVGVLGLVLETAFGFIPWLGPIASALAQAAGATYSAAVAVVLYFDIRCRKEAFDIEHLARLVESGGAVAQTGLREG